MSLSATQGGHNNQQMLITTTTTAIIRPLHRTTCIRRHPQL